MPCSRIGHIARPQPYNFPKGREATELRNYKRAVEVWMGDYKKYVYRALPAMQVGISQVMINKIFGLKNKNIILSISLNICFGCSKELSH